MRRVQTARIESALAQRHRSPPYRRRRLDRLGPGTVPLTNDEVEDLRRLANAHIGCEGTPRESNDHAQWAEGTGRALWILARHR